MRRLSRTLRWFCLGGLAALAGGVLLAGGLYLYLEPGLPDVARLQDIHLQAPLRVYAANGALMAVYGSKRRYPVDIEDVPRQFRQAFIAAEDNRFYAHPGVDWMGILRAAWHLVTTGDKTQGGSTITMQVARNFFLTRDKTYIRKIREIFLALRIHHELPKHEVLELYLNKIYLGEGAYGIAAAAQAYYGKDIDELGLAQMATIAGLPKAPSYFNPVAHPKRARWRRDYVLRRMHDNGMIDTRTLKRALARPIAASAHDAPVAVDAPYAAEMARHAAVERLGEGVYTGGYRVYTTVEPREQHAATAALRQGLRAYARRHGYAGPAAHLDPARLPQVRRLRALLPSDRDGHSLPGDLRPAMLARGAMMPADLDAALSRQPRAGALRPVVIVQVAGDHALAYERGRHLVRIPWDTMKWAAPRRPEGGTGPQPDEPGDVVDVGDIVHVSGAGDTVALAQWPDVQGAFVALDPHDGAIRALVGGYDFERSPFNRAVRARRQPGSNFKPFVYSAALHKGMTPATIINDAPLVFPGAGRLRAWRPQNYSGRVFGPTRLREGLVHSRNLVSLRVLRRIGVPYALDYVQRFGFDPGQLPHNLTLALGTASVSPLQIARGYAVFANMGYRVAPYLVTRIADRSGRVVHRARPATVCDGAHGAYTQAAGVRPRCAPRVIGRRNAYMIRSFMRDVARRGTGQGTRALGRDDIAVKTGTTDGQRDAWFSGYTSGLVATTWVGFDGLRPLGPGETGARAALPIWVDFMDSALEGVPASWPVKPAGIVTARIDPDTGARAASGGDDAVFEIFRAGNVPSRQAAATRPRDRHLF